MKLSEIYDSYYQSFPQEKRGSFALPLLLMGLTGLEPVTPALSTQCSNQLSYRPLFYVYS